MVDLATLMAIVLLLLPSFGAAWLLWRAGLPWSIVGLGVPCALALFVLVTMLFARVVPLEPATFVALGALALAIVAVGRRAPAAKERAAFAWSDAAAALIACAGAVYLSREASVSYWIWDREWHVPFATSLRGQRIPFHNVYEPYAAVHYHFAGDVLAAMFQSLSLDVMHMSRALSVLHDVLFGVLGGCVALALRDVARLSPVASGVLALLPPLVGPITLRKNGAQFGGYGFADFSNYNLSFRPGGVVAGLMLTTIALLFAARARRPAQIRDEVWLALLYPAFLVLSLADELSAMILGVAIGAVWLVDHKAIHARRSRGLVAVAGLAIATLVVQYLFGATLAGHGTVKKTAWLAARFPGGWAQEDVPFWTPEAWLRAFADGLVLLSVTFALVVRAIGKRDRIERALFALCVTAMAVGATLFLKLEFNDRNFEAHRFLTAARWMLPTVALFMLAGPRPISLTNMLNVGVMGMAAVCTMLFVEWRMPGDTAHMHKGDAEYAMNCRSEAGVRFGERPAPTYIDDAIWYPYAGCHPVYSPGGFGYPEKDLTLKVGWCKAGASAMAELRDEMLRDYDALAVACAKPSSDGFCVAAARRGACRDSGSSYVACAVPKVEVPSLFTAP